IVVASSGEGDCLVGKLAWDGLTTPPPAEQVLPDMGGANALRLIISEQDEMETFVQGLGLVFPTTQYLKDGERPKSDISLLITTWRDRHAGYAKELLGRLPIMPPYTPVEASGPFPE